MTGIAGRKRSEQREKKEDRDGDEHQENEPEEEHGGNGQHEEDDRSRHEARSQTSPLDHVAHRLRPFVFATHEYARPLRHPECARDSL